MKVNYMQRAAKLAFMTAFLAAGVGHVMAQSAAPTRGGAAERTADEMSLDSLPTDDEMEQEERDNRSLMRVQMQQASKNAASQDRIRRSNEEAASAQAALYKQLLESRKQQAVAATTDPTLVSDFGSPTNGNPSAAGQAFVAANTARGRAAAQQSGTPQRSVANPEAQKALDALAAEDGPEVARANGLAFIPMGTMIDLRMLTAVNTAIPGPVVAQVVYDVWDVDMKYIVIPRGSKAMGMAAAMGSDSEARGRISFSTFIDPTGRSIPMATPLVGSNRMGITGIDGKVNYHWGKVFGGSIVLGVVGGLLQAQTSSTTSSTSTTVSGTDTMKSNVAANMGNVTNSMLQRFIQVKPDIDIREGSVAKLIVTTNIMAKPYREAWKGDGQNGGAYTPVQNR